MIEIADDIAARVVAAAERLSTPEPNTGCVLWTGYVDREGYPMWHDKRSATTFRMPRALFKIRHRLSIDETVHVRQACGVHACLSLEHLKLGTAENNRDAWAEGRRVLKLSPTDVQELINLHRNGVAIRALARRFGIKPCSVKRHLRGWRGRK